MALLSAFNPHEFPESTVRAVATGREVPLAEVLAAIRANIGAATMQHLILSAPRGYGKSFMMRHIQIEVERIAKDDHLPLVVALMPEEMPHVREPETLIRELTRALIGGEAVLSWHEDEGAAWDEAVEALEAAMVRRVGETGLCVALVENFDLLLRRAFAKEVQASRLRALLTQPKGRLMLVAASASGAFDRNYDAPLFQAFKEIALEPWTIEDCLAFFRSQRRNAGAPPLDELSEARVKAVATFIGGTPRLATLIGDALLEADVLSAAELLQRLVDELTPYYKERVEALPGRAQKLLDALLRFREPATQSEIARRVGAKSQANIAAPFNDLIRKHIVTGERAQGSAEILYRVADRVFAHYYRRRVVNHGKDVCPLEALVDLLASFFSPEEKQEKAAEFLRMGRLDEARVMARLFDADKGTGRGTRFWILHDLALNVIPRYLLPFASEAAGRELRAIADLASRGEAEGANARARQALGEELAPHDRVLLLLARAHLDAYEGFDSGIAATEEAVKLAAPLADWRLNFEAQYLRAWSLGFVEHNEEVLQSLRSLIEEAAAQGDGLAEARASGLASGSLDAVGHTEEALALTLRAAELAEKAGDAEEQAIALRYAALSFVELSHHEEAVSGARRAAELAEKAGDEWEQSAALCIAASSLSRLSRHDEAVPVARRAAELAEKVGDAAQQAEALRHAAFSLGELSQHEEAVAAARRAAELAEKAGDVLGQARALREAAWSLGPLSRQEEAIATAHDAAELAEKAGDEWERAVALRLAAFNLGALSRHYEALATLAESAQIGEAAQDETERRGRGGIAALIGGFAGRSLAGRELSFDKLHAIFRLATEQLDGTEALTELLRNWVAALVRMAVTSIAEPERLDTLADAIELHFPQRFGDEGARLGAAARYHASGRDPASLVRLDPDFAKTLTTMFPPPKRARKKKK